ncbi:hypothetical protein [Nocardiopsis sp. CNR-923]|uniref:hypothetical protein n=1 Tax=Nocardiopsis sp. CNR-923 TaxID=1904965 RepID=UPI000AF616E5|nr:hypothetical protein [Nocardiopsis sp. CNR-923]
MTATRGAAPAPTALGRVNEEAVTSALQRALEAERAGSTRATGPPPPVPSPCPPTRAGRGPAPSPSATARPT